MIIIIVVNISKYIFKCPGWQIVHGLLVLVRVCKVSKAQDRCLVYRIALKFGDSLGSTAAGCLAHSNAILAFHHLTLWVLRMKHIIAYWIGPHVFVLKCSKMFQNKYHKNTEYVYMQKSCSEGNVYPKASLSIYSLIHFCNFGTLVIFTWLFHPSLLYPCTILLNKIMFIYEQTDICVLWLLVVWCRGCLHITNVADWCGWYLAFSC